MPLTEFCCSGQSFIVNCQTAQCVTIFCLIDNLQMGEGAVIEIQARFFEKTLIEELYTQDYHTIDWPAQRDNIAKVDLYTPHSWLYNLSFGFLDVYESYHFASFRQMALNECLDHIRADDSFTKCISIGPGVIRSLPATGNAAGLWPTAQPKG